MQTAITEAYTNPPKDGVTVAYQKRVPRRGEIPTPDEFVRYAAGEIKKKKSEEEQ